MTTPKEEPKDDEALIPAAERSSSSEVMDRLFDRLRRVLLPGIDGGRVRIAIALILVVGASALFWASRDYGVIAPDWDGQVRGIAYSPSHLFTETRHEWTSARTDRPRHGATSQLTGHIRTYTVDTAWTACRRSRARYGMTVSLGIWIGPDLEENEKEIDWASPPRCANRRTIDRVFVGNEAILRGDVTPDQLNAYIKRVRAASAQPHQGHDGRAMVDLAAVCRRSARMSMSSPCICFPIGKAVDRRCRCDFLQRAYDDVQEEFPDKPIIIGEAGWPSEGRTQSATPNPRSPTRPISSAISCSSRWRRATTTT